METLAPNTEAVDSLARRLAFCHGLKLPGDPVKYAAAHWEGYTAAATFLIEAAEEGASPSYLKQAWNDLSWVKPYALENNAA